MIILFLVLCLILTVFLLIIAFENVNAVCSGLQVFFTSIGQGTSVTILMFVTAFLGVITGFCYSGLFWSIMKKNQENEENEELVE